MNLLDKPTISGTIVVAKLGGSVLHKEELLNSFVEDVQMLVKSGVSIAIVHGGGPAINEKLALLNKAPLKIQGLRVTDAETLAIVNEVLSSINDQIVSKMSAAHLPCVGFKPSTNAMFTAEKLFLKGIENEPIDLGFVGNIVSTNTDKLNEAFAVNAVPVIAPLGLGQDGSIYNINADHAALAIAKALGANKLINITDVPGLLADPKDPSTLIKYVSKEDAEKMLSGSSVVAIHGGMLPKLESCVQALAGGVAAVQIIDGNIEHSLLKAVTYPKSIGSLIESSDSL